jgi:hypothetical protein
MLTTPRHYLLPAAGWTACGIKGARERAINYTTDAGRTTCLRCRRWLSRHGTADDLAAIARATWVGWKHDD